MVTTLVSDVATAYLTMRELDYALEISRDTLRTREAIPESDRVAAESAESRRCSTFAKPNNWCTPRDEAIPGFEQQIEQKRIRSAFCLETIREA